MVQIICVGHEMAGAALALHGVQHLPLEELQHHPRAGDRKHLFLFVDVGGEPVQVIK